MEVMYTIYRITDSEYFPEVAQWQRAIDLLHSSSSQDGDGPAGHNFRAELRTETAV